MSWRRRCRFHDGFDELVDTRCAELPDSRDLPVLEPEQLRRFLAKHGELRRFASELAPLGAGSCDPRRVRGHDRGDSPPRGFRGVEYRGHETGWRRGRDHRSGAAKPVDHSGDRHGLRLTHTGEVLRGAALDHHPRLGVGQRRQVQASQTHERRQQRDCQGSAIRRGLISQRPEGLGQVGPRRGVAERLERSHAKLTAVVAAKGERTPARANGPQAVGTDRDSDAPGQYA
jgi:hypothetical protein